MRTLRAFLIPPDPIEGVTLQWGARSSRQFCVEIGRDPDLPIQMMTPQGMAIVPRWRDIQRRLLKPHVHSEHGLCGPDDEGD